MRSFLAILVAMLVAVVFVLCTLALEPVRWCVVHMQPWWWRRPARVNRTFPAPQVQAAL
jgi:hypothetical protein